MDGFQTFNTGNRKKFVEAVLAAHKAIKIFEKI